MWYVTKWCIIFKLWVPLVVNTKCSTETTDSDRGVFEWLETATDSTVSVSCPNGPTGAIATRRCAENGTWLSPNVASCASTEISNGFKNITKVN